MKTEIHVELPQELIDEARAFIAQGLAASFDYLVADALRRYLDSHSARLAEVFGREDVEWGLHGRE